MGAVKASQEEIRRSSMGKKIVPVVRGKKKSKGSAAVLGTARRAAASFLAILLAVSDVGVGYAVEGNGDISME
ncbi:MAG: hypothetical protein Q4C63_09955, partial [Eubacteriales bacterium]|nr:hypothetical protein [Eubacteriales bacterium]